MFCPDRFVNSMSDTFARNELQVQLHARLLSRLLSFVLVKNDHTGAQTSRNTALEWPPVRTPCPPGLTVTGLMTLALTNHRQAASVMVSWRSLPGSQ